MSTIARLSEPKQQMLRHLYATGMVDMHQRAASSTLRALIGLGMIAAQRPPSAGKRWTLSAVGKALFDEEALRRNRLTDFAPGDAIEWSVFTYENGAWTHLWERGRVCRLGSARLIIQLRDGRIRACEPNHVRHATVRESASV